MTEALNEHTTEVLWLAPGTEPSAADWEKSIKWHHLGNAIVAAREEVRVDGTVPWVRWDRTVVFAPDHIIVAYPSQKSAGF